MIYSSLVHTPFKTLACLKGHMIQKFTYTSLWLVKIKLDEVQSYLTDIFLNLVRSLQIHIYNSGLRGKGHSEEMKLCQ